MKKIYLFIMLATMAINVQALVTYKRIILNTNGGENTADAGYLVADIGGSVLVPEPVKAGYTFAGWTSTNTNPFPAHYSLMQSIVPGKGYYDEIVFDGATYYDLGRTHMYTDVLTVNIWAYMDNWANYKGMRMISCTESGGFGFEPSSASTGHINFKGHDSGVGYKDAKSIGTLKYAELSAGWHMFTLTFDGNNIKGFVDGKLVAIGARFTSGAMSYHASNSILLGAEVASSNSPASTPCYFKGKLRSVSITRAALSISGVEDLYNETKDFANSSNPKLLRYIMPANNKTLKATWTANATTTLTLDANGGTNTMEKDTYSQAAGTSLYITKPTRSGYIFTNWDKTTSQYISNYQGIPCSSPTEVTFNGTSTYYALGREYMYEDALTVNVWAYMDKWDDYANNGMRLLSCTQTGGWNIEPNSAGCIQFAIYDKAIGYKTFSSNILWSELKAGWHMFTLTFNGATARGYVDGNLVGYSPIFLSGKIGYNATNSILIGAEPGTANTPAGTPCYFKGKMKNVAIMHTAITSADVATLYTNPGDAYQFFPTKNHTLKAVWEQSSTPTITTSATELTFETTEGTVAATQTITVGASNLSSNITATLSGTNAQAFTISPASLEETGGNITVTYTETTVGSHNATLTLSATGANSQTITLKGIVNAKAVNPETPNSPLVADKMSITLEGVYGATNAPYEDVKITGTDLPADITYNSVSSVITVTPLEGWDVRKGGTLRLTLNTNFTLGAGEYDKYVGVQSGKDIRIEIQTKAILKKAGTTTNIEATNKDNWGYYTAEEILYVTGIDAQEIALYNVGGQMVGNIVGQNQMTISGLKGVYIIYITDKLGNIHTGKIIIK